eukprot:s1838_g13.t1
MCLRMIDWVVTTKWSSFTCKLDWSTSHGYCSTVELVRIVVRNGLLRTSLSGKTLEVQGRKIVQLDCGNGHSLSVQFYVCTGIPFPLVSVARLLLQDFSTVMAKDYLALIGPMGNPVPIIGALIAAAQEMKAKEGYRWDMWEVNESNLKLIRHVRVWRNEMLDPRIKLANKSPVPITGKWSRLTGERVTFKQYKDGSTDGSTVTVRDENVLEWTRTAPRPYDPMVGRDKSKVVNDEIVEFRKADDPMDVAKRANEEPEVLDRQMRVSRNVEEHELENALRSLPQHGSRMKELLLQVFNLEDPETAAPRWRMLFGHCHNMAAE